MLHTHHAIIVIVLQFFTFYTWVWKFDKKLAHAVHIILTESWLFLNVLAKLTQAGKLNGNIFTSQHIHLHKCLNTFYTHYTIFYPFWLILSCQKPKWKYSICEFMSTKWLKGAGKKQPLAGFRHPAKPYLNVLVRKKITQKGLLTDLLSYTKCPDKQICYKQNYINLSHLFFFYNIFVIFKAMLMFCFYRDPTSYP